MGSRFNPVSFYIPLPRCMVQQNSKKTQKIKKKKKRKRKRRKKET
jgi:hypothetical protein